MKLRIVLCLLCVCLLTGCASLLEREYSTVEPHSSKFWESEAAAILRAENYQDVVNDLLLLVGERRETATLRLYNFADGIKVSDVLERATMEVQQETPMGAYAVQYITFYHEEQRGYFEAQIKIGYRRTAEQIQSVTNATTPEALYSLLAGTLDAGKTELAVRISYWGADGRERVAQVVSRLRTDRGLEEEPGWTIRYYPESEPAGLVEILLDVPPEETEESVENLAPEDETGAEETETTDSEKEEKEGGSEQTEEDTVSSAEEAENTEENKI